MDAVPMGMPNDVLIVEDDAIIALDFEDTIRGFGVQAVRTASNVARALQLIDDRTPDFALLDVGLASEKSFAVAERHRHLPGRAVNPDMTEELHAGRWRQVLLARSRRLDEFHFRPKRVVELVRPERAGMQGTGDEFPERLEILELRLAWIVIMRGRIVHVGSQPHRVD